MSAQSADRLRIAADILQERGIAIDERQLAALLGMMCRTVLWVAFYENRSEAIRVMNWASERPEAVPDDLRADSYLSEWFANGWKLVVGAGVTTNITTMTALVVEKVAV